MSIARFVKTRRAMKHLPSIKLLVLDCDGVMTDGKIPNRQFNSKDGLGIIHLLKNNVEIMIISGAKDIEKEIETRAKQLDIENTFTSVDNKSNLLINFMTSKGYEIADVAYIGDDVNDLTVKNFVKVFITPKDGYKEVRKHADYISKYKGGQGCIREISDLILKRRLSK